MYRDAPREDYARHHGRGREYTEDHGRENYESMYDDAPREADERPRHYDDERGSHRGRGGYRERDEPRHRSRSGGRYRSRSRSPGRDAGKPSDTVILEGLPQSVTQNEVGCFTKMHAFTGPSTIACV